MTDWPLRAASRGEDHVRRLLGDHVDGADDEEPGNAGKDRGVDDAQPLGAMHAKIAAEHAAVLARANRAAAGSVVSSCCSPHIVLQLFVALARVAWLFLFGDQPLSLQLCRQFAHKAYPGHYRVEILSRCVVALIEIMEVDQRRVSR